MKTNKMQLSANSRGDTCGGTQTTNLPVKSPAKIQFPQDCIHSDFHCSLLEDVELINMHGVPVKSKKLFFPSRRHFVVFLKSGQRSKFLYSSNTFTLFSCAEHVFLNHLTNFSTNQQCFPLKKVSHWVENPLKSL